MNTTDWRRALLWLVLVKVVYLAAVYAALRLWPGLDESKFYGVMQRWPREGGPVFASHFATWDAAHYLYLSEVGYASGVHSCGFYPLWPLLVRGFSVFTGGSHLIAGMVLANVFSLAAWVIFHRLVAARFGENVAKWALALLIVFPGSLFYQFIYSEPVFFLLVMGLWWALERQRQGWAWAAAALLPLARGVGVFCVLPIAWHLLTQRPPGWMSRWRWVEAGRRVAAAANEPAGPLTPSLSPAGGGEGARRAGERCDGHDPQMRAPRCDPDQRLGARWSPGDWALLAVPLLGWAAYLTLMWLWTGNPLEGIQAQKHWGVHSIPNLVNVPKFVIGLFDPTEWHGFTGSLLDRCMFILLLYTLPLQWRLGKDLLVWTYVLGILPAMSGTFTSFTRFEAAAFPMFIALAAFLSAECGRRKAESAVGLRPPTLDCGLSLLRAWLRWGLLAGFAVLHGVLLWRFVNFRWAG